MLQPVHLPQLGQTMEQGIIARWHKRPGERVEKGELLYELTTDKATLEVQAFATGIVQATLVPEGEAAPVGALIAVIGDEGDEMPEDLAAVFPDEVMPEAAPATPPAAARAGAAPPPASARATAKPGKMLASPRARKAAREQGVPLEVLAGSGPGGRIVEDDVLDYVERRRAVPHTPTAGVLATQRGVDLLRVAADAGGRRVRKADVLRAPRAGGAIEGERVPLSPMRRTIAARMAEAKQTVPHFYLAGEVAMRAALGFLKRLSAGGRKVTVTALIVKAIGLALREHPRVNAAFDGDAVVLRRERNVGVAVAVEDGLFVPVIRNADARGLADIARDLAELGETARAGKLTPEQYEGGTITLSNLGMFGVDYFLPIVNPPEACIVGVGTIRDRVVAVDGGIGVEPIMEVTLSADHRVVDGAECARFFRTLKGLLEAPGAFAD